MISLSPFHRILHSRGRDSVDLLYNLSCSFNDQTSQPTDGVAFPSSEEEVAMLLKWCNSNQVCVIPFGAGSSVVMGVQPPSDNQQTKATLTISLEKMNRLLSIDPVSETCLVEGGVLGPQLEQMLKSQTNGRLTLRYYPQSFEWSTVGGWVATRGGGHFATGPTHIDDLVQAITIVLPNGSVITTRRLPASGAGPNPNAIFLGSEGTLGVITKVST
jgi:alkyldihydroxyacetonephosphate synthase